MGSEMCIRDRVLYLLGGVFPFFRKSGKFSQARNFSWIRLNLMKLIYLKSALKSDSFDVGYLLVSKFRFLEFRLLLSGVAPYLQFVTMNCLIGL